jgi:hypothetical protein
VKSALYIQYQTFNFSEPKDAGMTNKFLKGQKPAITASKRHHFNRLRGVALMPSYLHF